MLKCLIAVSFCFSSLLQADPIHEIAITLDDLPFVAASYKNEKALQRTHDRFTQLINALKEYDAPATGFVIGKAIGEGDWALLTAFHAAGFTIGNHTYSHLNLSHASAEQYINDIQKNDEKLSSLMSQPKYFRYPYLAEGHGDIKEQVHQYLKAHDYQIAPVTIDSKDYEFNEDLYHIPYRERLAYLPTLKKKYLSYIWSQTEKAEKRTHGQSGKHILLLHANLLNSYCLPDILKLYKDHGYRFISLKEALNNPAPTINLPIGDTLHEKA